MTDFDVTIVGGGVLGLSLAYHLGQRRVSVCLIEREHAPGCHASGKNAGMFRQLYRHPKLTDWAKRSRESWPKELRSVAFKPTGSLVVGRTLPGHHPELFEQRKIATSKHQEIPGVFCKTDGLLDSGLYINTLLGLLDRDFVTVRLSTTVTSIEEGSDFWKTHTNAESISSSWVVNAAGAWVNNIIPESLEETRLAVEPFARHLFVVRGWEQDFMPAPDSGYYWDEKDGWYMRLWSDEERLVSVCDQAPCSPETYVASESIRTQLADKLLSALPEQANDLAIAQSWHCFRTYSKDQLPTFGEDPRRAKLFWLAGFGGFGMSTSFAATSDAAEYLCGDSIEVERDFLPVRLQSAKRKKVAN